MSTFAVANAGFQAVLTSRPVRSSHRRLSAVAPRASLAPVTPDPTAVVGKRVTIHEKVADAPGSAILPELVSRETVRALEAELDRSESVAALRRFNLALANLGADEWKAKLRPVLRELTYNLESFNPLFTAVLLKVQCGMGHTDYVRRDNALKNLIQPLAGEYGMHNGEHQAATHRELFSIFYQSLMGESLEAMMAEDAAPSLSVATFKAMLNDVLTGGGKAKGIEEEGAYAMGYNLAIEYLADYEKTWMLDSFRELHGKHMTQELDWTFLTVHAEGEAEHAAIGHAAVENLVNSSHVGLVKQAMQDHDRDFAAFYNTLADMLE